MLIRLFILYCLTITSSYAAGFYKFHYIIKDGDDFKDILSRFVKDDIKLGSKTPTVRATFLKNSHIANWKNLQVGKGITLYIGEQDIDKLKVKELIKLKEVKAIKKRKFRNKKIVQYEEKNKIASKEITTEKISVKESKLNKFDDGPGKIKFSMFYMGSSGSFIQKITAPNLSVSVNQISPWSLGLSAGLKFGRKPLSWSSSIYYSYLEAPLAGGFDSIEIPAEIGLNIYAQYLLKKIDFTPFAGVDYESFSTFGLTTLVEAKEYIYNSTSVIYITAGVAKLFSLANKQSIYTKFSFSTSIVSSTSLGTGALPESSTYSGSKMMGYVSYKFSKRWFTHALLKIHSMSGPDELSVSRYGIGIGFDIN